MQTLPTIVGLPTEDNARRCSTRIERGHVLILAFILLGLLSLSLLITAIVQRRHSSAVAKEDYCLTRGCLSAASYQLRSMDSGASANLCTDFYAYACGGWHRTHPIQSFDVERTILGDMNDRRDTEIERLLNAPSSRPEKTSWEYKLKTYYAECLDDYARVPDSARMLIELIRDPGTINGWFLFDNSAFNASQVELLRNQSLYEQLEHIHGDLGVLAVFGLRTRFDEDNHNVKRLEFYPAGLSMEVNDYLNEDDVSQSRRVAFQLFVTEIAALLARDAGVTDPNLPDRLFTVANDVFTVERFLAESIRSGQTGGKPKNVTLELMSAEFSFDFVRLMAHELDDPSAVTATTSVYLTNLMYFTDAFEYLNNDVDPLFARMIHNYLRWRLVLTYIDDLSLDYVHTYRTFLSAYYGYFLHATNEVYCSREIIRRFPLAIHRLHTMNSTTQPEAIQTVQAMFDALKDGFKQYINEQATWMPDESTKARAREKIEALTVAIGYASVAADDVQLDKYYEKLTVVDTSHLQNAFYYHRFHRWTLSNSLQNPNALDHWDFFETRPNRLFDYIALFNRLFVIATAMREPLVHSDWPWSVNMGSLGVLLAQKLFASIDMPDGRTHLANGSRVSDWWSSSTSNEYNRSRKCITDYYVLDLQSVTYDVNGAQIQIQLTGEPFSPTTLRHIGALRLAYNAFMKTDTMSSLAMPGTNQTGEQTFFLAYAQSQCYQRQALLQYIRTQLGVYDERTALNAALIHTPEFVRVFQCKAREKQCF